MNPDIRLYLGGLTWADIDMGRDRHGPRSTWAQVDEPRSTWAEIDMGRDQHGPKSMSRDRHGPRSTWAEINMGPGRWAEIDVGVAVIFSTVKFVPPPVTFTVCSIRCAYRAELILGR